MLALGVNCTCTLFHTVINLTIYTKYLIQLYSYVNPKAEPCMNTEILEMVK